MSKFDWSGLMRAGIRDLGLRPAEFWALTPAELMFMLGQGGTDAPLSRARLQSLSESYPDTNGGASDG
ncbi:phage conserved hypothetical protein [Poseidonocella pacifica]|uniref:Phage tail assembly chaperone protein, TAC n=1 Tax=Poseidonocella pacifica TaxID=871651 RepID=A0A1I0VQB6_9RHOB|nr:rcc01693 family protein [Poseidonocella pacifica]SFA78070.1 phage conserved hypothetical protein [Poseidonocella pacifica]